MVQPGRARPSGRHQPFPDACVAPGPVARSSRPCLSDAGLSTPGRASPATHTTTAQQAEP